MVLLGGRVAEELIFDDVTTGASNDIERVTSTARKMVCEWGMSDSIGTLAIGETGEEVFIGREWVQNKNYSEDTARLVDAEVKRIVEEAHERCRTLLQDNIETLHRIARALLDRETITGADLDRLMEGRELDPLEGGAPDAAPVDASSEGAKDAAAPEKKDGDAFFFELDADGDAPAQKNAGDEGTRGGEK